mgnify:CR=1 FL=1
MVVVADCTPYPSVPAASVAEALKAALGDSIRLLLLEEYSPPPVVLLPVSLMLKVQPRELLEQAIVLETCGVEVEMPVRVPNKVVVVLTLQLMLTATEALTFTAEEVAAVANSGEIACLRRSPNQLKTTKAKTKPIADQKPMFSLLLKLVI